MRPARLRAAARRLCRRGRCPGSPPPAGPLHGGCASLRCGPSRAACQMRLLRPGGPGCTTARSGCGAVLAARPCPAARAACQSGPRCGGAGCGPGQRAGAGPGGAQARRNCAQRRYLARQAGAMPRPAWPGAARRCGRCLLRPAQTGGSRAGPSPGQTRPPPARAAGRSRRRALAPARRCWQSPAGPGQCAGAVAGPAAARRTTGKDEVREGSGACRTRESLFVGRAGGAGEAPGALWWVNAVYRGRRRWARYSASRMMCCGP